jgi:hypothetical protein
MAGGPFLGDATYKYPSIFVIHKYMDNQILLLIFHGY